MDSWTLSLQNGTIYNMQPQYATHYNIASLQQNQMPTPLTSPTDADLITYGDVGLVDSQQQSDILKSNYDGFDCSQQTGLLADSSGDSSARNNRKPQPLSLEIASDDYNQMATDYAYAESSASTPSPVTPVFVNSNIYGANNYTFNDLSGRIHSHDLNVSTLCDQSGIGCDSASTTPQLLVYSPGEKLEETQTIPPAAVELAQSYSSPQSFTELLANTPGTIEVELSADYFNSKTYSRSEMHSQCQMQISSRRQSTQLTASLKSDVTSPVLSSADSPASNSASTPKSPKSPTSPQNSNSVYLRRTSLGNAILEDEEDLLNNSTIAPSTAFLSSHILPEINTRVNARLSQSTTVPIIHAYLSAPNPSSLGEKTVMVMTSKVAQKSYGTEKRFLCPPPTTIILGSSWWCPPPPSTDANHTQTSSLSPPRITVGISSEQSHHAGIFEWISPSGTSLDPTSCSEMAISGKCVSKHLYINDTDEKRKRVEVNVKIQNPCGQSFGCFASKPIKVISKPSKKRQSVKNMELCIHHGTTISLFNRIRSQTVSTKYLGVSGNCHGQSFAPWSNGAFASVSPVEQGRTFVARTGSWDPFIIWIVDTNYVKGKDDPQVPPHPSFPRPPLNALKYNPNNPIPIHYNQPVVLQCLSTGITSPVMIIRKVDKGSMVIGGAVMEDNNGYMSEALGDPVSQLHKVAFQIKDQETMMASNIPNCSSASFPSGPGVYLACLSDVVGQQRANDGRKLISTAAASATNSAPFIDMIPQSSNVTSSIAAAWAAAQTSFASNAAPFSESTILSSDGIRTNSRKRRVSSSVTVKPTTSMTKASMKRRRVNSMSAVGNEPEFARIAEATRGLGNSRSNNDANAGAIWTEDVTDSAVWTIVGTDCATYTFYCPQAIVNATSPLSPTQQFTSSTTPVTPVPSVTNIVSAASSNTLPANTQLARSTIPNTITIFGENYTRDLMVWFGDIPSPRTEYRSRECILAWIPDELLYNGSNGIIKNDRMINGRPSSQLNSHSRPILLSRGDGVIFKTGKSWI
ncbi:4394_t:CDS:2 [Paraglomus occultum]|uniref:4394_t:CDS:1 n=1 Tax=Paraglomus occultum TaxID=144539 RepID=A0A9N8VJV6_9GLOM|nr:4394_t:CDS:2 [Paraglomus occultum]